MNYYNPEKKQTLTRSLMNNMGLPHDDMALAALGYFPIEYSYKDFDSRKQELLPAGNPVRQGAGFVQNFTVESLDAERLAVNLGLYKGEALARLNTAWKDAEANGTLESEVGFVIDANERADRDIRGLITKMEAKGVETADFCAADNTSHTVTLDQLKTMQLEVIEYGQKIYAIKWLKRAAIENAATFEEVDAIDLNFAMQEE